MWFSGFFFLILSLIVKVYLWWKLQASLIFLSGRTCTIGGWLNTFLPHCIYIHAVVVLLCIEEHCKQNKQPALHLRECRVNMLLSASVCISLLCIRSLFSSLLPLSLSIFQSLFARSISVFQSWPVVLEESCDECGSGQIDLGDNPCLLVVKIHQRLMRRPTGPVIQHSRWVFVMRLWVDRMKTRAAHAGFVLRSPRWVFLSPPGTAEISHLDFFFSTFHSPTLLLFLSFFIQSFISFCLLFHFVFKATLVLMMS